MELKYRIRTFLIFCGLLLYSCLIAGVSYNYFHHATDFINSNLHLVWLFETQLKFPIEYIFLICAILYALLTYFVYMMSFVYKYGKLWFLVLVPIVFAVFGAADRIEYYKRKYYFNDIYIRGYYGHIYDTSGNLIIRVGDRCNAYYEKNNNRFRLERYVKGDTLIGFCDLNGNTILPCKYVLTKKSHGIITAYDTEKKKVGLLNSDYEFILPCEYEGLTTYEDYIRLYKNEDLVGLIDYDMNIRVPFDYSNIVRLDGAQPSLGLFLVLYKGKAGVYSINKHEEIIPCMYRRIEAESGFIKIRDNSDNYWGGYGACDYNGNKIVPCEYYSITKKEGVLWCEKEDKDSYAYKYDKYDLQGNYLGEDN